MAKKKSKFVPSGGEAVATGVPTITINGRGDRVVEYLTPRKNTQDSGLPAFADLPPLPSLLSTLTTDDLEEESTFTAEEPALKV